MKVDQSMTLLFPVFVLLTAQTSLGLFFPVRILPSVQTLSTLSYSFIDTHFFPIVQLFGHSSTKVKGP